MGDLIAEVRAALLRTMLEAPVCANNQARAEMIRTAFTNITEVPSIITFILYEVGSLLGTPTHLDTDSIFGSVIVICRDSTTGRLHVRGVDLPEQLERGSMVVLNPSVEHEVTFAVREQSRLVLTFNV